MNHRSRRLAFLMALAVLVQGCAASNPPDAAIPTGAEPIAAQSAVAAARSGPIGASDTPTPLRPVAPTVHIGTGVVVGAAPAAAVPSAAGMVDADGAVAFNFVNVDIRDIVREILGEQLHLGYVIDPKVQGTATVQTGAPIPREAVLPTLENVLRANGLAMINLNGIYRVLPIEDATRAAGTIASSPFKGVRPGFGIRILPLKFSSAVDLQRVLEPYIPAGGGLQADATRNILIATGTPQDLDSFAQLVATFDADWLAGMSYAIYPLKVETSKTLAAELEDIFGEGGEGILGSALRIVPLERLNAILVISPQPAYLKEAKDWIERLDAGNDETTPRLFQYYVQNSRATDLAAVLNEVFSSGGGGGGRTAQTAPGSTAVSLGARSGSRAGGGGSSGMSSSGISSGGTSSSALSSGTGSGGASSAGGPQPQPLSTTSSGAASPTRAAASAPAANRVSLGGGGGSGGGDLETPVVRIVADDKNNALVIYARPRDYRMVEATIKRLDIVPLQVLIEATIAEVTLNDKLNYGLQFFLKTGSKSGVSSANIDPNNPTPALANVTATAGTVLTGFNYVLGSSSANVILSALSAVTDVEVISSPQLMVLDHQTAVLQVGDQVPIPTAQTSTIVTAGVAPVTSNSIEYRDTGVILTVAPRVNASGLVTLDITQEVSDVSSVASAVQNAPTISQRRITTSVIVQDGATVALGGLITDNVTKGKSGIPFLSDIPIVGALFGTKTNSKARTELLVMFTPRVVRNAQEAADRTEELRQHMQMVKPFFNKPR
jgi:general secretion pathway protein D